MMQPEFYKFVEDATAIKTSGRWAAVNERIKQLCANPNPDNGWWIQVFASLCAQIFMEYLALTKAHDAERSETSLLAWRARNLLELSVWCTYCSMSRDNAQRLYEDAGRDVIGIFDAFMKWGKAVDQQPSELNIFTDAKHALEQQAVAKDIELA